MKTKKRILVAPLDWGIGHATRCISIIKALIENGYEVVIAADNRPLHLLSTEFPKTEIIRLEGYNITYSRNIPMSINMIFQIPKILLQIRKEHINLDEIIKNYNVDGVISDNRYGLHSKKVPCVFITHQLEIKSPYFTKHIRNFNYNYINKFDFCWIIDDKETNLAGSLSSPKIQPKNTIYIGTQSRFNYKEIKKKYDFLAIVSGPEPQRTILERGLINCLKIREEKSLIVLGKPEIMSSKKIGNLEIKSHLNADEMNHAILESKLIICRPGYSTIMDLKKLGCHAFFIPTPGQTEQEYLASRFYKKNICYFQKQSEFNFNEGILACKSFKGFSKIKEPSNNWQELFSIFN